MLGYHVPNPYQAMLVSGGKPSKDGARYRVYTGQGKWVMPGFRKVDFLSLELREARVVEECITQQGIRSNIEAIVAFHVDSRQESIIEAATLFLHNQDQMQERIKQICTGHLRGIVGEMTLEYIMQNRQELANKVITGCKEELFGLGLEVKSFQIQTADDGGSGYIDALAAPHIAAVNRAAAVAKAEADRASAEKQQESLRKQAEYQRETSIAQSQYQSEVTAAQATAEQAGPLADAQAQLKVIDANSEVAERQAALTERQLHSQVIKPAEAKAREATINAEAQAKTIQINAQAMASQNELVAAGNSKAAEFNARATRVQGQADADKQLATLKAEAEGQKLLADAQASNDRVNLDELLIKTWPAVVANAASGISGANITMLNGAEGYAALFATAAQQGKAILDSLKDSINSGKLNGNIEEFSKELHKMA